MTKVRVALMAALAVVALVWLGRRVIEREDGDWRAPQAEARWEGAARGTVRPAGDGAGRVFGTYRPGARTAVPRFVVPAADAGAPPRLAGARPRLAAPGDEPPRSRFEKDPPDLARMQSLVKERLGAMHARAERCLEGWMAADPALEKGVMVGIEIDRAGLMAVWIQDLVEIPSGPLACLGNAAYEIDWGGITDRPITVTVRQRYQASDAGG